MVRPVDEDGLPGECRVSCHWEREVEADYPQEIMMFLQALPTKQWTDKDIELLLSEAFIWQSLFQDSRAHLRPTGEVAPEDHM